jgi:uncharacterized protein (DUF1499 family)
VAATLTMPPRINDISTDLDDPPAYPRGKPGRYPERFKAIVREHYPALGPLRLSRSPDEVFAAVRKLAEERELWNLTCVDEQDRSLQGVARTRLLRFRDDYVVRVRADGDGAVVDMRSKSRLGKADFGANARRIRDFLADLERTLG